jgi:hypothetical protein
MTEEQHKLVLLEKGQEHTDFQLKRFMSHLESEQRVTNNISKRVDASEKLVDKHEKMLINDGRGLMFRMDRIEQREAASKSNLHTWFSVLSLIISLVALIIMMYVK